MSKRPASSADDKQPKRAKKDETDTTATLGQSAVRALAAELQAGVSHVERCLGLLASGHTVPFIARYRAHETGGMEPPLLRRIEAAAKEAANLAARCDAIVATLRKADRLTAEAEHRPPAILMGLWFSGVMYRLAGVFCSGRALDSPMSTTGGSRGRER